jgi:hypothetical protein
MTPHPALGVLFVGSASRAIACPFCDGGPSGVNEVKEAIFGADFLWNLGMVSMPFLVFAVIIAAIHSRFSEEIA